MNDDKIIVTPDALRPDCVSFWTPLSFNYGEGYGSEWEYKEASRCEECGHVDLAYGEERCPKCDEGYLWADGPMMNNWYLLPDDIFRYGTDPLPADEVEAAKRLVSLPLCIVEPHFNADSRQTPSDWGMALTGGGMDLIWEIAEAYMRLGYLPPARLRLPKMAGYDPNDRRRWIVEGLIRAGEITSSWAKRSAEDAQEVLEWMENNQETA